MKRFLPALLALSILGGWARAEDQEAAVTLTYLGPNAKAVGVAGEFNNWRILPLDRSADGVWTKTLHLRPGQYAYKLVVDDEWILDPKNPDRKTVNGIENSMITAGAPAAPAADTVAVEFKYTDANAKTVYLAGDFNQWLDNDQGKVTGHEAWQLQNDGNGNWKLTRQLQPGRYLFKYVVDGARWVNAPGLPTAEDGNSILEVKAPPSEVDVKFEWDAPEAKAVTVAGEFNQWNATVNPLTKDDAGKWSTTVRLKPGKYAYKFVVDGAWKQDPANPNSTPDGLGGTNSVKTVEPQ